MTFNRPPRPLSLWLRTLRLALLAGLIGASTTAGAITGPLIDASVLATVPRLQLDSAQVQAAIDTPPELRAPRFAVNIDLDTDIARAGGSRIEGDRQVRRVAVHSDDAVSLSAMLTNLRLPSDSTLTVLDGSGVRWHGPYTAADVTASGRLQTPLVPGDTLLLELASPLDAAASATIGSVQHGYQSIEAANRSSGTCNNDVACAKADPWADAIRAATMITIGGRYACSAVLLNNTNEDQDPLLLTAHHCGIGSSDNLSADSVVVIWNYQTSSCGGKRDGHTDHSQTGTTLLATYTDSDFTLVRLNKRPDPAFNAYYAGWDATTNEPYNGVSVHYPSSSEASISFYDSAYAQTGNVDGQHVASWVVKWTDGVTEPGSSGSGLWNSDHRVVGQLSGGNSSCDNPEGLDLYGRMDTSWNGGGAPDNSLRPWLDPAGTGARVFDGLDPQNGSARANDDLVLTQATSSPTLLLDPLANDIGIPPLTLISAQTDSGQVDIVDNRLDFAWAEGVDEASIDYAVRDRSGEVHTATMRVQRMPIGLRGGAISLLVLLLGAAGWRRIRRR